MNIYDARCRRPKCAIAGNGGLKLSYLRRRHQVKLIEPKVQRMLLHCL
jgi:hypothetical protein